MYIPEKYNIILMEVLATSIKPFADSGEM